MASWFERVIDTERWTTAFNCVTELYAVPVTPNTLDGSDVMHSSTDHEYGSIFFPESDDHNKEHEHWIEE